MIIKKKWNWKIYFVIVFFCVVLLLAARVVTMLADGQVSKTASRFLPSGCGCLAR